MNHEIWEKKYKAPGDGSPEDTFRRVARAAASVEKDNKEWERKFFDAISDLSFMPGGRILAGAGAGLRLSLNNCYVIGDGVPDDMHGIFETLKESALTMQAGGGIGLDFSTLRPKGAPVKGVGSTASGPVSFMHLWDAQCATVMSAGARRGAQMAVLRCDHPDIEEFVTAKRGDEHKALKNCNLSVAVTDAFIDAVEKDLSWELVFGGKIWKTVRATDLWERIARQNYDYAEPGVLFIDRINALNNLYYCENIRAANPCGEQPLPAYSACCLGSLNLTMFMRSPFEKEAEVDFERLQKIARVAVRFLDNVVEISWHTLLKQRESVRAHRRIGLGITGLANVLAMIGERYGSEKSIRTIERIMAAVRDAAYDESVRLADEKGSFPLLDKKKYLEGTFVKKLPQEIRNAIGKFGIRNSHLLTVAPTGTTSLLAGNISSGVEPVFDLEVERKIKISVNENEQKTVSLRDYAFALYREKHGEETPIPECFVTAKHVSPEEHIAVQAAVQKYVDASISKTINLPESTNFEDFKDLYLKAYKAGMKGCTVYRQGCKLEGIVSGKEVESEKKTEMGVFVNADIERPHVLKGNTYKIKPGNTKHALYVTITDISNGDGTKKPFEIFLNTKDPSQFEWMAALTRLISAVFRKGDNPLFLVDELKCIHSPTTGYFSPNRKKFIPSIVAEIGEVLNDHLVSLGMVEELPPLEAYEGEQEALSDAVRLGICPDCGQKTLKMEENCQKCFSCGYTKC